MLQDESTCQPCLELKRIIASGSTDALLHWQNNVYEDFREYAINRTRKAAKSRLSKEDADDKFRNIMLGEPSEFWCRFVCQVEGCVPGEGIKRAISKRLGNDVYRDTINIMPKSIQELEEQQGGSYVADSNQQHVEDKLIQDEGWQSFKDDFDQAIFQISQELSPRLAVFLDMWYFQGMEEWQISEKCNVSKRNVSVWKSRTIEKLSDHHLMMLLREKYDSRTP